MNISLDMKDSPYQIAQVYYNLADDHTDIFLTKLTYESPKYFRAPFGSKKLSKLYSKCFQESDVEKVYCELRNEYLSQFEDLISPVLEYTKPGDVLWLIPDDLLHFLPFAAIPCKGQLLIHRNPLVYSPSMTAMAYCRHWRNQILSTLLDGAGRSFLGVGVGPENQNRAFIDEIKELSGRKCWKRTKLLTGTEATKENLMRDGRAFDVIHMSGHAVFSHDDPLDSYLLVSNGCNLPPQNFERTNLEEYKIRARDLLGQSFSCDLITLASCWTGQSKLFPGDTRFGLGDAFLAVKTASLIVSRWAAQVEATNFLLDRFYRYWLEEDTVSTKAHALQKAMIDTMNSTDNNWDLPFFWANFVLIGDWV